MKKILFLSSLVVFFIFLLNLKNIYKILPIEKQVVIKNFVLEKYENLSDKNKIIIRVLKLEPFKQLQIRYKRLNPSINNLNNDYNIKFLPLSQTDNFNLSTYKINFKKEKNTKNDTGYGFFKPFFIEISNDNLIVINNDGEILFIQLDKFFKKDIDKNNLKFKSIKTNLKIEGNQNSKIMGTLVHKEKVYVSHLDYDNNCQIYNISYANINFENLIFKNFFKSKSCGENLNAGRMKVLNFNGSDGLLATMGGEKLNEPSGKPQDLNSDIGKIIFIDFKTKEKKIYSMGHRNPQGLFVEGDLIIATEHGPKGGDEINKIEYGKNYGWPIASYGKAYDHSSNNFKEPIFSFIPSIGISEIIKISNKFSTNWHENFLLASLNGGSLYRIKFNSTFEKIIYKERIFVNKRIRDLKYSDKYNAVILALEDWKEIGILNQIIKD